MAQFKLLIDQQVEAYLNSAGSPDRCLIGKIVTDASGVETLALNKFTIENGELNPSLDPFVLPPDFTADDRQVVVGSLMGESMDFVYFRKDDLERLLIAAQNINSTHIYFTHVPFPVTTSAGIINYTSMSATIDETVPASGITLERALARIVGVPCPPAWQESIALI